jgi:hypothetical protein
MMARMVSGSMGSGAASHAPAPAVVAPPLHAAARMTPEVDIVAPSPRCCPRLDAGFWQGRMLAWKDRPFARVRVRSLLHVPLNLGGRIRDARALIDRAGAASPLEVVLVDDLSAWGADVYLPVSAPVPGLEMAALSGTFITKVFEGPYRDAPSWAATMRAYIAGRGRRLSKLFFGYTTCPSCARAYGANHVVLFALVEGSAALC